MPTVSGRRAVRIAGASGSVTDRRHAMSNLAKNEDVDVIFGDWMSEYNMTSRGADKLNTNNAFEPSFLEAILPALPYLAKRKIKVAVNAGASDTKALHSTLVDAIASAGLSLKCAWIEGDEVHDTVKKLRGEGMRFENLISKKGIDSWEFETIYAQCYLGGFGIARAFSEGADIVICGRVADASPVIGASIWWHGWTRENIQELSCALVAGHLVECSNYVTGGNFTGFKDLGANVKNIGYPIAEIGSDGDIVITKDRGTDGLVNTMTCSSQLLYEIQGPWYFNSDCTADLEGIKFEQIGNDRVRVTGIKGLLPPPTTRVALTGFGGYQAEAHYFMVGLDIQEKAAMIETQIRNILDTSPYHCLKFRVNGTSPIDAESQDAATVDFRIFAQSKDPKALEPMSFLRPCTDIIMQSYPGATFAIDSRQGVGKPYYEFWVALLPQSAVNHRVHFDGRVIDIDAPTKTSTYAGQQRSYDAPNPTTSFGETVRAPLGYIVHARSGDKASNANVGFFVRHEDEWEWLRTTLSIGKIKELLAKDYRGGQIDRFELPGIHSVHFLLHDHLDRGVSSSSTYDVLGKNVAEYIRAKTVDIPKLFLDRGRI